jgi:hypothetical protein
MDSSDRTPFHIHECFVGRRCCGCPANDLGFLGDPLARERNEICGLSIAQLQMLVLQPSAKIVEQQRISPRRTMDA